MSYIKISALLSLLSAAIIIIINFYPWYTITYNGKPIAKKWGKVSLFASFLFILISALLLLFNQGDNEANKQFIFKKQTECMEICSKIHSSIEDKNQDILTLNPKYTFNQEKNACFYSSGQIDSNSLSRYIINCQTNEEVLSLNMVGPEVFPCSTCADTIKDFNEKELEYFK